MAVVAMMTTVSVNAQNVDDEPRNQIAISYGYMSNSNWIDAFENFSEAIVGGRADNETFIGPISVEYFYRLNNPLVNVGAIVAFGLSKEDVHGAYDGDLKHNYYTFMPAMKLDWFRREHVAMYSKIAAGITYRTEKIDYKGQRNDDTDNSVHFSGQLTGFGVEFGSREFRGFVEGGFGEQGLFLAGLRCRF